MRVKKGQPRKLTQTETLDLGRTIKSCAEQDDFMTLADLQGMVQTRYGKVIGPDTAKALLFRFTPHPAFGKPTVLTSMPTIKEDDVAAFYRAYSDLAKVIPFYLHFDVDETALVGVPGLAQKVCYVKTYH